MANVPRMIYGTAWKKDRTRDLVCRAINAGFRAIDTAAQPKHYQEDLVGAGIRDALQNASEHALTRQDLYIQTKFTPVGGQDPRSMPYDPQTSLDEQVHASIASSLRNLRHADDPDETPYLDAVVLHSPLPKLSQTMQVWRALESYHPHTIRTLGISNVYQLSTLEALYQQAVVKPSVVQNRFCRETDYGRDIRAFCDEHGIVHQTFWTLTANPRLLKSGVVVSLAKDAKVSAAVALYFLVTCLGNVSVLNGTTNEVRMREDVQDMIKVQAWASKHANTFTQMSTEFRSLLE